MSEEKKQIFFDIEGDEESIEEDTIIEEHHHYYYQKRSSIKIILLLIIGIYLFGTNPELEHFKAFYAIDNIIEFETIEDIPEIVQKQVGTYVTDRDNFIFFSIYKVRYPEYELYIGISNIIIKLPF